MEGWKSGQYLLAFGPKAPSGKGPLGVGVWTTKPAKATKNAKGELYFRAFRPFRTLRGPNICARYSPLHLGNLFLA